VIVLTNKPETGFLLASHKNTNEFEIADPDERPCQFCSESSELLN